MQIGWPSCFSLSLSLSSLSIDSLRFRLFRSNSIHLSPHREIWFLSGFFSPAENQFQIHLSLSLSFSLDNQSVSCSLKFLSSCRWGTERSCSQINWLPKFILSLSHSLSLSRSISLFSFSTKTLFVSLSRSLWEKQFLVIKTETRRTLILSPDPKFLSPPRVTETETFA